MRVQKATLLATSTLAGVAALFAALTPAYAQDAAAPQPAPTTTDASTPDPSTQAGEQTATNTGNEVQELVVTGTRLRTTEFTSADPIQVITADQSALRGQANTAQIIQGSTVAGNGTQINNYFTGYVVDGGPGVNTVSLRGLGTTRTLVLVDGKRLGPAGVQGAVGAVDLNTIPSTLIDRIEILKDGSSSIYGSDAVAGVVNIITKKKKDGGEFHVYAKPSDGGDEYDFGGRYGKTFGKAYVGASFDAYRQNALRLNQRDYLSCSQDFVTYVDGGGRADIVDPRTGQYKCWNIWSRSVIDANNGRRYAFDPLTQAGGYNFDGMRRIGYATLNPDGTINVEATRANYAAYPYDNPRYNQSSAISPVSRYTLTLDGSYEITPRIEAYGDFMFNRRVSNQIAFRQLFPIVWATNPSNPLNPASGSGYTGAPHFSEPIILLPSGAQQHVDYSRFIGGFRGDLPDFGTISNVHYDIAGQFSQSKGRYTVDTINAARVDATSGPDACDPTWFYFNANHSMADLGDTAACVPIDWTRAAQNDRLTPAEAAFLLGSDTGHTTYEQGYVEGDVSANLFDLPAGPVAADVGFNVRHDRINNEPGPQTLADNLWASSTEGVTRGDDTVKEVFAEVEVPIVRDKPFLYRLDVRASGRYSDYKSYGVSKTYKAAVNWSPLSWMQVKYTQGTSFRSPALYELYLASQTGYLSQLSIDPCIDYTLQNSTIQQNCASQGIPDDYNGNINGGSSSAVVTAGGGYGHLAAETALSKTMGVSFTPHWFGTDLGLEVDYYENHISNGIQQFGAANILNQCYGSANFPNNDFCTLFTRDMDPTSASYLSILNVDNNYVNVADVMDRGIDVTLMARRQLPWDVTFRFDSQLSWTLEQTTSLLGGGDVSDYNGSVGYPDFVGNVNFRFDKGTWTLNWFTNLVGKVSDSELISDVNENFYRTGQAVKYRYDMPFYDLHTVSLRRTFEDAGVSVEGGVINVFDKEPPIYSSGSIGQTALASQYDLVGRTIFLQFDKKF
ncbi:MAG: TonB-dependent receptor domain-containing protein [Parcubacteria group bacterium]